MLSLAGLLHWRPLKISTGEFFSINTALHSSHLLELLVPRLDDVDDAGVGVEDDKRWEIEGPHGRVDDVPGILVVLAFRLVVAVSIRV